MRCVGPWVTLAMVAALGIALLLIDMSKAGEQTAPAGHYGYSAGVRHSWVVGA
ncbi:hypothetical protein DFR70_107222 [Nocardia tenerifensis]|uniref:Uncharacterized protein n=1 Tax=Nocardia tenerifensis TaxID=228006 RepID=A0A318K182_9NOCA|nr:hypothetical protein [Nocardia tenerifensis]PXX62354.1 hypothetical protein DFR70_107222 [Nocardia tenerifensis]